MQNSQTAGLEQLFDANIAWRKYVNSSFLSETVGVIPPDADLHPSSSIALEMRGKVPGKPTTEGWVGLRGNWKDDHRTTEDDARTWAQSGAGVGMQGRLFPAIDIDVGEASLARKVKELAFDYLGITVVRARVGSPRLLLIYKCKQLRKKRLKWTDANGKTHAVELLGYGQYYNVEAPHPKGGVYEWDGEGLCDVGADSMPEIDAADVDRFFAALEDLVKVTGGTITSKGRRATASSVAGTNTRSKSEGAGAGAGYKDLNDPSLHAPNPELVLEALSVWKNTDENLPDHDDFVDALRAIKASLGPDREQYYPHVERWALDYPGISKAYIRGRWDSFDDSSLGWSWLAAQARKAGFDGDVQLDYADPPYDPKSFFDLDVNAVCSQTGELGVLKAGWPEAYEQVRAELDRRSTISGAELDALISERGATDDIEPRAKRPRFLLLDELDGLADPNDFIEGLFCDGQSSVIYGDTNIGKSFFALDLGMHVALGRRWFGREVERGAVVYVAGEGGGGMRRRIAAFLQCHKIEQTKGVPFALIPNVIDFRDQRSIRSLIETCMNCVPVLACRCG